MQQLAVIYARQSEDVAEGINRQLTRCRALAALRGWEVVREYEDNDTSASKRRGKGTQWARMLDELRDDVARVVIAVDLDRLLRDTRDLFEIIDTGARVLTVDGEIDLTTADGEFRATMLAGIARFEVRRKSERQLRANASRSEAGRPIPGRRRYGYETDGVTPREAEAAVVRRMFDHVTSGGSVRSLARALTAESVDPAPGKLWSNRRVRDIVNNEHYAGYVRHLGQVFKSEHVVPLVDEEQAAEARAILRDPSRRTNPGGVTSHLLSGIATCAVCGRPLAYMRAYVCPAGERGHPSINDGRIEPLVVDEVVRILLVSGADLFPSTKAGSIAALVGEHERNAARVSAVLADRDEGLVPAAVARARLVELRAERETIEAELERVRTEKSQAAALHDLAQDLLEAVSEGGTEWAALTTAVRERFDDLLLEQRREIIRGLLHVEVAPQGLPPRVRLTHRLTPELDPAAPERDPAWADD